MASIKKRGNSWYVEIDKLGVRKTASFPTHRLATNWGATTEAEIIAGKRGEVPPNKTFGDLLQKYHDDISPTKRGSRPEQIRIKKFLKDPLAEVKLTELNATHFAAWRDRRLKVVSPGTVLREWNTMSNACKVARGEWHWMKDSPLKDVAKPKKPPPRTRRPSAEETKKILFSTGYRNDIDLKTATSRVGAAYLFAMESALRAGEICALRESEIFFDEGYLRVTGIEPGARKNTAAVRNVPLTAEALRILKQVLRTTSGKEFVFDVSIANLDALYRKAKNRMEIEDLTFHDTRHEAITRLARKYEVLDLAILVGHTNLDELRTYYNPTIKELVGRLRK